MSCSALHEAWHDDYEAELAAAKYDVHIVSARHQHEVPDDSWPTTALLGLVLALAQEPPWVDPLNRSIRLTSALARLGERGLRADTVVRTCLGPQLLRRILLVAGSMWLHQSDSFDSAPAPQQLQGWFNLFKELQLADPSILGIISAAGNGRPAAQTRAWLTTGAVAHLINWDLDALTVTPDWLVLPGGRDATLWVWDRFTATSSDLWRSESLSWEIAFAEEPANVAAAVGLPLALLNERPPSAGMAMRSLRRRVLGESGEHQILGGLTPNELAQDILGLIETRNLAQAGALARRAWEAAPTIFTLGNAAGFCLVATNPNEATRILEQLKPQNAEQRALVRSNLLAAAVAAGVPRSYDDDSSTVPPDLGAFLWDLTSLGSSNPQICYTNVSEWLAKARASAPGSE
jgi:hypothetical protein